MTINSEDVEKIYSELESNSSIDTEMYKSVIAKNNEKILNINNEIKNSIDESQLSLLKEQKDILCELNTRLYSVLELNIDCGITKYDFSADNKKMDELITGLKNISQS